MSGEIREIHHCMDRYGVNFVLQEIYDICNKEVGNRFISKDQFWEYIEVLKQKEGRN
jgi:hypothetical protein